MPRRLRHLLVVLACLTGGWLACTGNAFANPQDYPQFAQQKVEDTIPIDFIRAETVKQRLDDGTQQLVIDVRNRSGYEKGHLPGAISVPLQEMPYRMAEIPRDIPVVLY